jgi:hypothetical protein
MEYYSAIKEKEIMLFAGKWIQVDIIMLSKISQTEKEKYHVFSHLWNLDLKKNHDDKMGMDTRGR